MAKPTEKPRADRTLSWTKGYIYVTATILGLLGLFLLSTVWSTRSSSDWWLGRRDPLLGLGNRTMLVLGGVVHLGAAAFLFSTRDLINRNLLTLWVGLNHLIYYAGVVVIEPSALQYAEQFLGWRLRLSPSAVDVRWKLFQAYLIVAAVVFLLLHWRRSKRARNETWFKQWQETRNQPQQHKPAVAPKKDPVVEYAKMRCPQCNGKIAFPLSRMGENIACPHCATMITLRHLRRLDS